MKHIIIAAALLLGTSANLVYAQNDVNLTTKKATALDRKYLRPSLTKLYISDGSRTAYEVINSLKEVTDDKFDYNNVRKDIFQMSSIPDNKNERKEAVTKFIEKVLVQEKIPNQIMHCWFPADQNGNLLIDQLIARGNYAATDADIRKNDANKRNTMLNELGEQLIDRSYIIAYVVKVSTTKDSKGNTTTSANVIPYVYKLDFNEEVRTTFYDEANYSASGIDNTTFPTKYVMNANSGCSCSVKNAAEDYDDIMILTRKVADFQVKTPITYTHPIRANIGKKEGVSCDKRYAVMRMVEDKNGNRKAQRVATVRATGKILDNRSMADGIVDEKQQTKFYEIKGRKVTPGETLVENPDFGLNIAAEYTISEASLAFEYRFGKHLNVPGLFVYLKAGVPWSKGLGGIKILAANSDGEWKSYQVFEGSIGFAKEFNFAGSFALTAGIEGGYLFAPGAKKTWCEGNQWYYDKDKNFDSKSYKVGANVKLGYYVTRNIQLYANAGYNYFIKSDDLVTLQEFWANSDKSTRHKFQKFQPLSFGLGLKVGF